MRMMSIASGSSGNCIYIGSDNTHILIDTGISRKKICEGLRKVDLSIKDIDAVLVTHEHCDHISGLGVISRKDSLPVFASAGTIEGIQCSSVGELPTELFSEVSADVDFQVGDLVIHPFRVSHDAKEPLAYTVRCNRQSMGVVTDLGEYNDYIIDNMQGLDAILVEANHDVRLVQVGSYPYYLKQRILGRMGHLSNENSGKLLGHLLNSHMKGILLGHLSKENNYEQLAFETVRVEIDMGENEYHAKDFCMEVAGRSTPSSIITV